MAQTASTATGQQSQTNNYSNPDLVAFLQNIMNQAGGLAGYMANNYGQVNASVAPPTDLTNEYYTQVANNAGVPDVSGQQTQMNNVGTAMNNNMAPTNFNFAPGQVNLPQFGAVPQTQAGTVGSTAADYQYNPQQVSGPTVSATQVQAPGAIDKISGLQQVQAPQLQNYQMSGVANVNAPQLSQFQMAAAAPISAGQITAPQSWTNPGTAAQYMSPYTQQVVDAQLAQAQVQNQQQIEGIKSNAVAAGAFGGSREAVEEANQNLGYQQLASTIQAQGLQSAYQSGQQQFTTEQQMQQQQQGANVQSGLAASQANQAAQQQANVQNLSSFLQTQGLGAQTGLQSQMANQQAGLAVGQANLGANLQTQGLGAQMNMQGQLANQATGLQSALANQQAQEFGSGQQLQASLANQQSNLQAGLATAGYNMQGQLANQASGLQAGLAANQLGFQGASLNANLGLQSQMANQAAGMQAQGMQYQGGLQSAMQTQNLGMQGQMQGAQMGLAGNQINNTNLVNQGNLANQSGELGLNAYNLGLQGMTQLGNAAASSQGYQQQVADTATQNAMNAFQIPFQGLTAEMGIASAAAPYMGSTSTSDVYNQGQTDAPTFNWGAAGGRRHRGRRPGRRRGGERAGAKRGGLMLAGQLRYADGGLADVTPLPPSPLRAAPAASQLPGHAPPPARGRDPARRPRRPGRSSQCLTSSPRSTT